MSEYWGLEYWLTGCILLRLKPRPQRQRCWSAAQVLVAADVEKDSRHMEEEACSADQTEAEAEAEAEAVDISRKVCCTGCCKGYCMYWSTYSWVWEVHTNAAGGGVSTGGEVAGTPPMVKEKVTWKHVTMMSAILRRKLTSQTGDAEAQASWGIPWRGLKP